MSADRHPGHDRGPVPAETRWWLIRHAPVPDPEGRIIGRMDLPADTNDVDDLEALARLLPLHAVLVTTPLMRTGQTARALAAGGALLPRPLEEPAFLEQDLGAWQGQTWGGLASQDPPDPVLAAFWADPARAVPPGGESFVAVVERVAAGLERLSRDHAGRDIVAVVHAGAIRAALAVALGLAPAMALRLVVDPLSLTRMDRLAGSGDWDGGWRVGCVNCLRMP